MDMQQMLEKHGVMSITIEEPYVMHNLNWYGCGYHVCMNIWNPLLVDDGLACMKESGNDFDHYAVAKEGNVGHVRADLLKVFLKVLNFTNSKNHVEVTEKRVNRGAEYGLEIHVKYCFHG